VWLWKFFRAWISACQRSEFKVTADVIFLVDTVQLVRWPRLPSTPDRDRANNRRSHIMPASFLLYNTSRLYSCVIHNYLSKLTQNCPTNTFCINMVPRQILSPISLSTYRTYRNHSRPNADVMGERTWLCFSQFQFVSAADLMSWWCVWHSFESFAFAKRCVMHSGRERIRPPTMVTYPLKWPGMSVREMLSSIVTALVKQPFYVCFSASQLQTYLWFR